jgi:flavorubredoxin
MASHLNAVKVKDNIFWVGAIDGASRDFHGYRTGRGTTYNAYLVLGEKIALIDTVKANFKAEMMARISSIIDPSSIDYVISLHAEMDHSGCLPAIIAAASPEKVFASKMGASALAAHFHDDLSITQIDDEGGLSLGGQVVLKFFETRFLHWPDSMFCYLPQQKILFSQDAFGMHLSGTERFDDEVPAWVLEEEAARYYANILLPYSPIVQKLIDKLENSGIAPDLVAPAHGPIWRSGFKNILGWYKRWSSQDLKQSAVVLYDSMWGSTDLMARAISDGLASTGAGAKQMSLSSVHRSDAAAELLEAGALIVGSPTLNNQVFPTVADAMSYLKGLRPKPRPCATFGSFGWSGESVKHLEEMLGALGFEHLGQAKAKWVPDAKALEECWGLGQKVGNRLMGKSD